MPVRLRSTFGLLVAGYAMAVLAFDHLVATGAISLDSVASSPVGLLHGRLWTMLTSGLVSADDLPIVHTVALAALLVTFAARHGGGLVLRTAVAAHVGSAVLAYAGLLLVTGTGLISDQPDLISPDYGTSCVWFGCVAGLIAIEMVGLRGRRLARGLLLAVGAVAIVASAPFGADPLTTAEHVLAIAIGAWMGFAAARKRLPGSRQAGTTHPAGTKVSVVVSRH